MSIIAFCVNVGYCVILVIRKLFQYCDGTDEEYHMPSARVGITRGMSH
jgi:hypothetical protein